MAVRQVQMPTTPVAVEAKRHVHATSQAVAGAAQRFQPRRPSACQELMYMFDGDANGVCHHVATSFGTQQWVNPVLSGQIKVGLAHPQERCFSDVAGDAAEQNADAGSAAPCFCRLDKLYAV